MGEHRMTEFGQIRQLRARIEELEEALREIGDLTILRGDANHIEQMATGLSRIQNIIRAALHFVSSVRSDQND